MQERDLAFTYHCHFSFWNIKSEEFFEEKHA